MDSFLKKHTLKGDTKSDTFTGDRFKKKNTLNGDRFFKKACPDELSLCGPPYIISAPLPPGENLLKLPRFINIWCDSLKFYQIW